jgi:putative two-component system response regulator
MQPQKQSEVLQRDGEDMDAGRHRIVIVDDEAANRAMCRHMLEPEGLRCAEAVDGEQALHLTGEGCYDLVLLDVDMPGLRGTEVVRRLRENPPSPHLKVIMMSGRVTADEMARMMAAGADDYLGKPFSQVQLRERVKAALRLKDAQDRSDLLHRRLMAANHELERDVAARDSDLIQARNALVLALAELVAQRDSETGAHLLRLQHYSRCLAETAATLPGFAGQMDPPFIDLLECCAPLHDIGKVGVPDHILLKPGRLSDEERRVMQRHTVVAAETLRKVADRHGFAAAFMQMAVEIARHHHERFDGTGYPDRLAGEAIPLAARIVAVADVYDALRCRRVYKPALPHGEAMRVILEDSGHFDPALLVAFQRCSPQFERLFQELAD